MSQDYQRTMSEEEEDADTAQQKQQLSVTEAFMKVFTSQKGLVYKLCPKEWLITDWGFGPDYTCCGGDCHPLSMKDIRKLTQCDNDTESFLQWACMVGQATAKEITEVP